MRRQTFGSMIAMLRKEKGLTQLELAEQMGVTDKAVSKWERDLSFPDVSALPRLAAIFDMSVDELLQAKADSKEHPAENTVAETIALILKCVALAIGVAVAALSGLRQIEPSTAVCMLGIGLTCLAVLQLSHEK